jgi:hypothetical protein
MNYQAVVRNASGDIRANENVQFEFELLQGSATGTVVYTETHDTITNDYGLISVIIGKGTTADVFEDIDWASGPYFIKVSVDGTEMGTSQLVSVPYALHAQTVAEEDTSLWSENGTDIYYNSGNVGVGTTTPNVALQVNTASGTSYARISDATNTDGGLRVGLNGTGEAYILNDNANKGLNIGTEGSFDVSIDQDGNAVFREKVMHNSVGTAHLLPVAYGLINANGTRNDTYSTNNFTVSKLGTGSYRIAIDGYDSYPFIPMAIVYGGNSGGVVASISLIGSDGTFDIYCHDTSTDAAIDIIVMFVAYRP